MCGWISAIFLRRLCFQISYSFSFLLLFYKFYKAARAKFFTRLFLYRRICDSRSYRRTRRRNLYNIPRRRICPRRIRSMFQYISASVRCDRSVLRPRCIKCYRNLSLLFSSLFFIIFLFKARLVLIFFAFMIQFAENLRPAISNYAF